MADAAEQQAAVDRLHALLQEISRLWGDDDGGDLVVDWVVLASLESVNGIKCNEDGEEINEYLTLTSPGLSSHACRGLIEKARDRNQRT